MKSIVFILISISLAMSWYCQTEKRDKFKEVGFFLNVREQEDRLFVVASDKLGYTIVLDTSLKMQINLGGGTATIKDGVHQELKVRFPILKSPLVKCPDSVAIDKISHVYLAVLQNEGWTSKKKLRDGKTKQEFLKITGDLYQHQFHSVEEVDSTIVSLKREFFFD